MGSLGAVTGHDRRLWRGVTMARSWGRICLLLLLHCSLEPGHALKCYNDGDEEVVKCDENLGYRTCFIRYNEKGGITGRGCSTKDKVYYKECETNSYGEGTEKFCYCNFYLCNSALGVSYRSQGRGAVCLTVALLLTWSLILR